MELDDWRKKDVPAWYELSYLKPGTLGIEIHQKVIDFFAAEKYLKTPRGLSKHAFPFPPLIEQPSNLVFDFGNPFLLGQSKRSGWLNYELSLPILRGEDGYCRQDFNPITGVRATLECLFLILSLFKGETGSPKRQLLVVEGLRNETNLHGGSLWVYLTPSTCLYLRQFPSHSCVPEIDEAMSQTYQYLWPEEEINIFNRCSTRCQESHFLHLSVPGNACGLDPDYHSGLGNYRARGYSLSPHNVDSYLQQFSLLMGLAKLHDLVRQAGP
jgi:hypothetical protein